MTSRTNPADLVRSTALGRFARRLLDAGEVSAVVAGVGDDDRLVTAAAGLMVPGDAAAGPIRMDSWFDIASLTKPFAASVALELDLGGVLPLDTPLGDYVAGLPSVVRRFPLQAALRHQAGLIPWFPFYSEREAPGVERFADRSLWRRANGGSSSEGGAPWAPAVYSDLGPALWSVLVARAGCEVERILTRLGFEATYKPDRDRTAGTALSNRREVELASALGIAVEQEMVPRRGVPQDGNARFIRQSGHAGLFARLVDVIALGREWLAPKRLDRGRVEAALRAEGRYALGWWRADPAREGLPPSAFGHNGFTGCSLWVEPERRRVMALLAHRTKLSDSLEGARREFHRLALDLDIDP